MQRFIALIWNRARRAEAETAHSVIRAIRAHSPDYDLVLERPGMRVLHANARHGQAYRFGHGRCVVIGTLFRRSTDKAPASNDPGFDNLDMKSLVDGYWGRYIAFFHDPARSDSSVLRDPAGQFPCFHLRLGEIHIYFSDARDLVRLDRPITVNWRFLLANLVIPELVVNKTGLGHVTEVLAGECHKISSGNRSVQAYWEPEPMGRKGSLESFDEAARALKNTVRGCVAAWGSSYDNVIHNLSGGIDSSIVLACLKAAKTTDIVCLNYRTRGSEGDERVFARRAAKRAGCDLVEIAMPEMDCLSSLLSSHPLTVSPEGSLFGASTKARESEIARQHQAGAFMSGEGGDHLFFEMATDLVAADYARAHGLTPDLFAVVVEIAAWTGQSFWSVLSAAVKYGLGRRLWKPAWDLSQDTFPFLRREAVRTITPDYLTHSWIKSATGLPPGKLYQVQALSKVLHRCETSARTEIADVIHPLLSQPIIELALRIPTYLLAQGGQGRALARAAFAGEVPKDILARRTKGGTTSHFARLALNELDVARDFLLDGFLAQQDFIDRPGLESCLTPGRLQRPQALPHLFKLLATEAWLRSWQKARPEAGN